MTAARRSLVLAAGLGLLPLVTTAAQGYPKTPPAPAPLTPAPFPPFRESVLPNGLRLLVVESHKQPVVSLSLNFLAGASTDPAGKEGLAEIVAGLLTKGAGRRTAEQVAEAIESAGGSLNAGAGTDFLSIDATVLTPSLPLALELMRDAVVTPAFPDQELELLRTQTLSGLQVSLTQPGTLADRQLRRALYGPHPYARSADPASVRTLTRTDLLAFQRTRLRPAGALLVVAGDVRAADLERQVRSAFQGWTGSPPATTPPAVPPVRSAVQLILVHRPGSVQSNILVGNLTFAPTDPRDYAATVANQVLGGGASGRLFQILREEKSWTYGAYAQFVRRRDLGFFEANTEVRTEVTDSALRELLHQLERIRSEPVAAAELDAAKGALTGKYPLTIETADQVAAAVATARLYGLPGDYVQTYRVRLGAVTAPEVLRTAQAVIRPASAVIVVVGDAAKVYDRLKDLAPLTLMDPEGNPLSPSELHATAGPLDLDLSALVPRRDSFAILVARNSVGWQRGILEAAPDGYRYIEDLKLAGFVEQTTTLEIDRTGGMRSVKQTGKQQGQEAMIDVNYAAGRAKGTAKTPDPATRQIKAVSIDTALAPGTLDDNAIQALIPAFRWGPGAKWTMNVLSAGQGEIKQWSLAVTGTESVKLGSGTAEAYRAELNGGDSPLVLWVTTASPHRLVKIAIAGQPVEFQRVP